MGSILSGKSCYTNSDAPSPNPNKWELIEGRQYKNSYIIKIRYEGCTNFEGIKIMVYKGIYKHKKHLDPHFEDSNNSPIARFKPTEWELAVKFTKSL